MKLAKFWKALVQGDDHGAEQFTELAHDMQKGTRVMQILCSEAKCRKELGIVAKVRPLGCYHTQATLETRRPQSFARMFLWQTAHVPTNCRRCRKSRRDWSRAFS